MIVVFAMLGLLVGSFLNVCIDRLPRGQSIIGPRSHCDACGRSLGPLDLIPLVSYLRLRGRCRYCSAPIPTRVPIVEAVTGLAFALLYWKFGPGLELAIALVYAALFLIITIVDLEHMLVLDKVVFPGMALALLFSFFWPGVEELHMPVAWIPATLASSLTGGAIGLAGMALPYIIYRRGMGMGDVKLGALVGLAAGYPSVLVALLLAVISGGLVAGLLLVLRIKKRSDPIPFAPFLAISAMAAVLWGNSIYRWYLG
ncbi:MAG: prepilin peptidase [Chloroflexi bacterium]|nr:prepilin peptidase [Chloroflexota bacterium]